ncbi:MAG: hypothetical protein MUE35_00015 [Hydrogenophaga sp.]|nr:hypothetical protein [Hydrogenophaga sp.]
MRRTSSNSPDPSRPAQRRRIESPTPCGTPPVDADAIEPGLEDHPLDSPEPTLQVSPAAQQSAPAQLDIPAALHALDVRCREMPWDKATATKAAGLIDLLALAENPRDLDQVLEHIDDWTLLKHPEVLTQLAHQLVAACENDLEALMFHINQCLTRAGKLISPNRRAIDDPIGKPPVLNIDGLVADLFDDLQQLDLWSTHACLNAMAATLGGNPSVAIQAALKTAFARLNWRAANEYQRVPLASACDWVANIAGSIQPAMPSAEPQPFPLNVIGNPIGNPMVLPLFLAGAPMAGGPGGGTGQIGWVGAGPAGQAMKDRSRLDAVRRMARSHVSLALVCKGWHNAMLPTLRITWVSLATLQLQQLEASKWIPAARQWLPVGPVAPQPLAVVLGNKARLEKHFRQWNEWLPRMFTQMDPDEVLAVLASAFEALPDLMHDATLSAEQRAHLKALPGTVVALAYRTWVSPQKEPFERLARLLLDFVLSSPAAYPFVALLDLAMLFEHDEDLRLAFGQALNKPQGAGPSQLAERANRWIGLLNGQVQQAPQTEIDDVFAELASMPSPLGAGYMLMVSELATHANTNVNQPRLVRALTRLLQELADATREGETFKTPFVFELYPPSVLLSAFEALGPISRDRLLHGLRLTEAVLPCIELHFADENVLPITKLPLLTSLDLSRTDPALIERVEAIHAGVARQHLDGALPSYLRQ